MPQFAFFKKRFVPLSEAKVGIMTHALNYGTACFEGIRGNWNGDRRQMYLFRLEDHYRRMLKSCHILKIRLPYTADQLSEITVELVAKNGYKEDIYVRPIAYKSSETVGVRLHNLEDDFFIFVTPFGPYLDTDKGARCCISSWRRIDDNMIPPRAKVTGLYVNSALPRPKPGRMATTRPSCSPRTVTSPKAVARTYSSSWTGSSLLLRLRTISSKGSPGTR